MTPSQLYQRSYEKYYYQLCYFAMRMIHDQLAAEDIAHEALSSLILTPHEFTVEKEINSFLYLAVRRKCIDYLRSKKNIHKEEPDENIVSDESIINEIIRVEVLEEIYQGIDKLPGNRREVLVLMYKEGLTIEETAKAMGYNKDVIRSLRSKAVTQLIKLLKLTRLL